MRNPNPVRSTTQILRDGFSGNLPSLPYLQVLAGLSNEDAARFLLVSPETYRRWRADRRPNPTAVRLLAIRAGYVPWPDWFGWEVHSGVLFPPGYDRHGISPSDFYAFPFWKQLVSEYQRQLEQHAVALGSRAPRPRSGPARAGSG